jgi:hypothetical protein
MKEPKKYFCVACFNIDMWGYSPSVYPHSHTFVSERKKYNTKKDVSLNNESRTGNHNDSKQNRDI